MAEFYDSFSFGGVNMLERFGVRVLYYDLLTPPLRARKLVVPGRSGAYDFGAKYYDERLLRLECDSRNGLLRADLRELAYLLSKKQRIVLWDDPARYYIGRMYDPAELGWTGSVVCEFTLSFLCDPFAYGVTRTQNGVTGAAIKPEYAGTAPAPVRIQITNNTAAPVSGVHLLVRERRDSY